MWTSWGTIDDYDHGLYNCLTVKRRTPLGFGDHQQIPQAGIIHATII
jgi:hypothetical protein